MKRDISLTIARNAQRSAAVVETGLKGCEIKCLIIVYCVNFLNNLKTMNKSRYGGYGVGLPCVRLVVTQISMSVLTTTTQPAVQMLTAPT